MFLYKYKKSAYLCQKTAFFQGSVAALLQLKDGRRTGERMERCALVPFLHAKKANVPILGPRFLVKFPRVGRAIEVKCPTYARGPPPPPLGLNIDRCITFQAHNTWFTQNMLTQRLLLCPAIEILLTAALEMGQFHMLVLHDG